MLSNPKLADADFRATRAHQPDESALTESPQFQGNPGRAVIGYCEYRFSRKRVRACRSEADLSRGDAGSTSGPASRRLRRLVSQLRPGDGRLMIPTGMSKPPGNECSC